MFQGACAGCDNPIQSPVKLTLADNETKDFCSTKCLNNYEKKHGNDEPKKKSKYMKSISSNREGVFLSVSLKNLTTSSQHQMIFGH